MRNVRLVLEYDGSVYRGFQRQRHGPTIQEELEKALSRLFNRRTKIKAASGRTDAGVHAVCQVVNFFTTSSMECARMQKGLNGLLPRPIAVKELKDMPRRFHARYDAKSKIYEYQIWNHPVRSPLLGTRAFHVPEPLKIRRMRQGISVFRGRHDFGSFSAANGLGASGKKDKVRTVKSLVIKKQGPLILIRVEADGFLYHMVRNLVGALVDLGRGKISEADLKKILKARDRRAAPPTAPAHALTLAHVTY